ncbi:hypothetical protein WNY37_08855 [Henriciella sp. AS95]|uniref:hypothetical protein n=1 Tax=Henriciella sp. AS95 TaxID=3135782 RepID=UPI00317AE28B
MHTRLKFFVAAVALFTGAAAANAESVALTEVELTQVTQACEVGLPLIPVSSDYGYDTGEYALPLSEGDGEVHSALIVSATVLENIPECRAEIDAFADREERGEDRIS